MKILSSLIFCLFILCSVSIAWTGTDNNIWTPEKSMKIRTIEGLKLSPDSRWVAFAVKEINLKIKPWTYLTHIWIVRTDGTRSYQLTRGTRSCTSPLWTPDGRWIAFLSDRNGKSDIWIINPFGGEARQLTDVPMGVSSIKFSPDGRNIAFLMPDKPSLNDMSDSGKQAPLIMDKENIYVHLYVLTADLQGDILKPKKVTQGEYVVNYFDWSPDCQTLVFSHQPSAEYDQIFDNDISWST